MALTDQTYAQTYIGKGRKESTVNALKEIAKVSMGSRRSKVSERPMGNRTRVVTSLPSASNYTSKQSFRADLTSFYHQHQGRPRSYTESRVDYAMNAQNARHLT